MKKIKLAIQIIILVLFPGLITLSFSGLKNFISNIIAGNFADLIPSSIAFIIITILTIFMGRIFCGWMCIFGSFNDWVYYITSKIFKKKIKVNKKLDNVLKYLKYVILFLIITFVWTGFYELPIGSSPWDVYSQLLNIEVIFNEYLLGLGILILITIGSMFIERFFCRYLCPLGAYFGIISKIKIFKIKKERINCSNCKACTAKCPMGIDLDEVDYVNSAECIQCYNCVSICPKKNAKLQVMDVTVPEAAITVAAIATTVGVYTVSNQAIINNVNTTQSDTNSVTNNTESVAKNTTSNTTTNTTVPTTNTTSSTTNTTTPTITTKYKDGTYTGTGRGYHPGITVSVVIKNDKIVSVTMTSSNETPGYYEVAAKKVPAAIVASQSTNVSVVSGATRTSNGIMDAVDAALLKALN